MVDKIKKALQKLSSKERSTIEQLLKQIQRKELDGLDIKKLKGRVDIYRVRKGTLRVLFQIHDHTIFILAVERRSDTTYRT